jgi:hypothetical protein
MVMSSRLLMGCRKLNSQATRFEFSSIIFVRKLITVSRTVVNNYTILNYLLTFAPITLVCLTFKSTLSRMALSKIY